MVSLSRNHKLSLFKFTSGWIGCRALPKTHKRSLKELKSNNNVADNVEKATEELPPAVKGKAVRILISDSDARFYVHKNLKEKWMDPTRLCSHFPCGVERFFAL